MCIRDRAGLAFILNVVLDGEHRVIGAFAGDIHAAHEAGCSFVRELAGVRAVDCDVAITTNGGYPLDQNIYQAVKGMTAAEATLGEGGVIIAVAGCADGHGGEGFFDSIAGNDPVSYTHLDVYKRQVLGRGAAAIGVRGRVYSKATIDMQLFIRHEEKKVRRAGGRTQGPAAFTDEDRERFRRNLSQLLSEALNR